MRSEPAFCRLRPNQWPSVSPAASTVASLLLSFRSVVDEDQATPMGPSAQPVNRAMYLLALGASIITVLQSASALINYANEAINATMQLVRWQSKPADSASF